MWSRTTGCLTPAFCYAICRATVGAQFAIVAEADATGI